MDYETAMELAARLVSQQVLEVVHTNGTAYVNAAHVVRVEDDLRGCVVLADGTKYYLLGAETANSFADRLAGANCLSLSPRKK